MININILVYNVLFYGKMKNNWVPDIKIEQLKKKIKLNKL